MNLTVVGMLSGTSYDAVDAAVADLSFVQDVITLRPRGLVSTDFPQALRDRIGRCLPPNTSTVDEVCRLDTELGQLFGAVAARANTELADGRAQLVASHGQTFYHWVSGRRALGTLQLGGAAWIADRTGLPVLSDLRTRDVTRGGQGAPLASTIDALLLLQDGVVRGSLNLGGIANITVQDPSQHVLAYDIGPASALMDCAVTAATAGAQRMDTDGRMAARGRVDEVLLDRFLHHPFYRLAPPKSTGKEWLNADYIRDTVADREVAPDDLLRTLTELTARVVANACREHGLQEIVVSGGGVRNPVLMDRIQMLADPTTVRLIDDFGIPAQAKEAYMCALVGFLSWHGLPGTIASATGAEAGSILGSFTPGDGPLRLPEPSTVVPRRLEVVRDDQP